ncbi:MAG: PilN domain-containing protein [Gemmatimonadetes bacterium]|nr:PilN domain-containing protein [Gemmatimonadota bacterium]
MVRINLLSQPEQKKKGFAPRPSLPSLGTRPNVPLPLVGGVVFLLLLSGAVFVYFSQNRRMSELDERIDAALQDSTRYSRAITRIRDIESSQSAIAARIQAIQSVDQGRFRWAHIMEELSDSLPEYTWLTSVVQKDDLAMDAAAPGTAPAPPQDQAAPEVAPGSAGAQGTQIEITGVTFSNLTLTRFMTSLENSPFLEHVSLVGSNRSVVDGVDVTTFALTAAYTQPPTS